MFAVWKKSTPAWLRKRLMVGWYSYIGRVAAHADLRFMNHGFDDGRRPPLPADLEPHRYSIQLYHYLLSQAPIAGEHVLEVSSGLGGGVEYTARCFSPLAVTGLDIAPGAVEASRKRLASQSIDFIVGSAAALPFEAKRFGAVLNVESSLNYENFAAFVREVDRVLKPGGHFLFACYRKAKRFPAMVAHLESLGWEKLHWREIGQEIVNGLTHSNAEKRRAIEKHLPRILRGTALRFARLDSDYDNEEAAFQTGAKRYLAAVLRKPASQAGAAS